MKKLLSFVFSLIFCFTLISCNKKIEAETNTSQNTKSTSATTSKAIAAITESNKANINTDLLQGSEGIAWDMGDNFSFDSYDRFFAHLSDKANKKNSIIQSLKSSFGEKYERFVNELTAKEHIETPHINGERMPVQVSNSGIVLFSSDIYGLPWIWYQCIYGEERIRVTVQVSYPHVEEHEDFSNDLSTSQILSLIDPSAVNIHNYTEFEAYKKVYEKEIKLSDRTASAIVYELKNSDNMFVKIYYNSSLITFRLKRNVYESDFFSQFSMQ